MNHSVLFVYYTQERCRFQHQFSTGQVIARCNQQPTDIIASMDLDLAVYSERHCRCISTESQLPRSSFNYFKMNQRQSWPTSGLVFTKWHALQQNKHSENISQLNDMSLDNVAVHRPTTFGIDSPVHSSESQGHRLVKVTRMSGKKTDSLSGAQLQKKADSKMQNAYIENTLGLQDTLSIEDNNMIVDKPCCQEPMDVVETSLSHTKQQDGIVFTRQSQLELTDMPRSVTPHREHQDRAIEDKKMTHYVRIWHDFTDLLYRPT